MSAKKWIEGKECITLYEAKEINVHYEIFWEEKKGETKKYSRESMSVQGIKLKLKKFSLDPL